MNDILIIARLRIALQRAFLGRAILRVIQKRRVKLNTFAITARNCPFGRGQKSGLIFAHAVMVGVVGIYST